MIAAAADAGLTGHVPARPPGTVRDRLAAIGSRRVRRILTTTFLGAVAEYSVYTYIAAVLGHVTRNSGGLLSLLLFAFGVAGLGGTLLTGMLTNRVGCRALVLIAVGGMAVDFALLPVTGQLLPTALLAMVLWGLVGWMYLAPQQQRLLETSDRAGALVVSLNSSFVYAGAGVGDAVGGVLITVVGARWTPLAAAFTCAVVLGLESRAARAVPRKEVT